jgi:hypothetical protein
MTVLAAVEEEKKKSAYGIRRSDLSILALTGSL